MSPKSGGADVIVTTTAVFVELLRKCRTITSNGSLDKARQLRACTSVRYICHSSYFCFVISVKYNVMKTPTLNYVCQKQSD